MFVKFSGSTSGVNAVVAAVAGMKIRVKSYVINAITAVTAKFEDDTGTPVELTGAMALGATGTIAAPWNPDGHFETSVGKALNLRLGGAVLVTGHVTYDLVKG